MPVSAPQVVCLGGGHGLAVALRAVRQHTDRVTAIVTTADDGGSSGALRRQLGIPAPGDLRMAIDALAENEDRAGLIQYRFKEGELAGHPLGNLLIAALADLRGDFAHAVEEVAELASVRGRVLPATTTPVRLTATIDGREVRGQVAIARGPGPVQELRLDPADAPAYPAAVAALEEADLVLLGPGSLFTSVIAALLPRGMRDGLAAAARRVLVLNLAEQMGETIGMDGAGHVGALLAHVQGLRLDAVLVHEEPRGAPSAPPPTGRSTGPSAGGEGELSRLPVGVDPAAFAALRAPVVRADLRAGGFTHDPDKLARALKPLLS